MSLRRLRPLAVPAIIANRIPIATLASAALLALLQTGVAAGEAPAGGQGSPSTRAARLVSALTLDEKIALVHTRFGTPTGGKPAPPHALMSAGVGVGVPRLGIPSLEETDAGLGVANPANIAFDATAMPSSLALGATFDPALAARYGAAVGAEARDRGFSVVLGGGADLIRAPRGGRNFEYVSEDPLLTGLIAGAEIRGAQSRHIVSTLKHFALNDQENGRVMYSADLAEAAARESDLLAFEIALEHGRPGAVMSAYNRVNGIYASQNAHLLTDILKGDWRFGGWVMSDWGGTHSTEAAAKAGLDQESGQENDEAVFFGEPLKAAVKAGRVSESRLDDMVRRMLKARLASGAIDDLPQRGAVQNLAGHAALAQEVAEQAIVLLKNAGGVLPLGPTTKRLLLVGREADKGVLSGGGSSQVVPSGSIREPGEPAGLFYGKPKLYDPSSPLDALRHVFPHADIRFLDGSDSDAAVRAAQDVDGVIVIAEQWSNESLDHAGLALPHDQDRLVARIAANNPKTIVVLQTGDPVSMPWLDEVPAVLEAWYSGGRGAEAIADVLSGRVDPSGRLPVSFPLDAKQLPRPTIPEHRATTSNADRPLKGPFFSIDYNIEGADIGYKWYRRTGQAPLFAFGHGLSYTRFATTNLTATASRGTLEVDFDLRNTGKRAGIDTPQVYLEGPGFLRRLGGWQRVSLSPGEARHVTITIDPRLLASFDVPAHGWRIAGGSYRVTVLPNALADGPGVTVAVPPSHWPARHGACGGVPCEAGTDDMAREAP